MVSGPSDSDTETKAKYITVREGYSVYLPPHRAHSLKGIQGVGVGCVLPRYPNK